MPKAHQAYVPYTPGKCGRIHRRLSSHTSCTFRLASLPATRLRPTWPTRLGPCVTAARGPSKGQSGLLRGIVAASKFILCAHWDPRPAIALTARFSNPSCYGGRQLRPGYRCRCPSTGRWPVEADDEEERDAPHPLRVARRKPPRKAASKLGLTYMNA